MHALAAVGARRLGAMLAAILLAGCAGTPPAVDQPPPEAVVVPSITDVQLAVMESAPPQLMIRTAATVPSAGWTDAMLYPDVYVTAPQDGIWGFTFHARPPAGPAAQVLSTLTLSENMGAVLDYVRGITIRGETNSCTAYLDGRPTVCRP